MDIARTELLIAALARSLSGCRTVAVGATSPLPAAAALLARAKSRGSMRVMLLGSREHSAFTDGGRELFDCAAQGRIDAFFLSGGQIDGQANLNLIGTGDYPRLGFRFPGSFGSAYLYFLIPKVILFREEHSTRVLVPKVDFVSAPGVSAPEIYRRGGPHALITGRCVFAFEQKQGRFRLVSVHRGESADSVRTNTGFDYDSPEVVPETPAPTKEDLALLRERLLHEVAETYPRFAAALLPGLAA
jgi:glutaconate CoA-transferase subunit B